MNVIEKILSSHAQEASRSRVGPGDTLEVTIDLVVRLDYEFIFPEVINQHVRSRSRRVRVIAVYDHYVPPPNVEAANGHLKLRRALDELGVDRIYYGEGIAHVLLRETGEISPGMLVVASDSHTTAAGAINALGRGLGALELLLITCTGKTWFQVPEVVRINLEGVPGEPVMSKDIFLYIAREIGGLNGKGVEVGGSSLKMLSIDSRANISAMFAELNVEFAVFEADEILRRYVVDAGGKFKPVSPDLNPEDYVDSVNVELDLVEPMVAVPHGIIGNVKTVAEVEGVGIDAAFIGSCGGGTLEDLRIAARILRGRRVHRDVRLVITPATRKVYLEALRSGILYELVNAGAIVTSPGCGACFGGHMGVVGSGETIISSSTRNFKGRMGSPDSQVYLASSATVAASAVAGKIVSPKPYLKGGERVEA